MPVLCKNVYVSNPATPSLQKYNDELVQPTVSLRLAASFSCLDTLQKVKPNVGSSLRASLFLLRMRQGCVAGVAPLLPLEPFLGLLS